MSRGILYAVLALLGPMALVGGCIWSGDDQIPPLHDAASIGDVDWATELIAGGADLAEPDYAGRVPLHHAAGTHPDVLELLIEAKSPLDIRDEAGWTAIMTAYYRNDPVSVEMLARSGADLSINRDIPEFSTDDLCDEARLRGRVEMEAVLCR